MTGAGPTHLQNALGHRVLMHRTTDVVVAGMSRLLSLKVETPIFDNLGTLLPSAIMTPR